MATFNVGYGRVLAETTVPVAVADGAEVMPWYNEYGQAVNFAANLASGSIDVSEVAPWGTMRMTQTMAALTAAGNTAALDVSVYHNCGCIVVVTAIDTSVVFSLRGTYDLTNYVTIGTPTTAVLNGNYLLDYSNRCFARIYLTFESETGGTNVVLTPTFYCGN
jgi:hypothetical protein